MKEATFDPAKELTLYFRCNRAGSKDFVFVRDDGSAYSFIYDELELNIYKNQGDKKKLISLTHVSGITLSSNTVTASITKALSNIPEGEYYWELYRTDLEKTWLTGDAIFHNGKFDGVGSSTETITVTEDGDDVNITIQESGIGEPIQFQDEGVDLGNAYTDTVDFVGAGVTATRTGDKVTVTIPGGSFSGLTAARVIVATGATSVGDYSTFTFDSTNSSLTINGIRIGKMPGGTANSGLYIGASAGSQSTWTISDGRNIAIGSLALSSLIDGSISYESSYNFAAGYRAGQSLTTGLSNVLIGHDVGRLGTAYIHNTIIGSNSASTGIITGGNNSLFGYNVAIPLTSGSQNAIVGYSAGQTLSTGNRNSLLGGGAAQNLTTGSNNSIIGSEAWEYIQTHSNNTGLGYWNGVYQIGERNTAIGAFAFGQATTVPTLGVTTLTDSTALGYAAGVNGGFGAETINGTALLFVGTFSGYLTGVSSSGLTNAAAIGTGARVGLDNSMVIGGTSSTYAINYGFGGESYGGGRRVIFVKDYHTVPSSNPTGGFILYSDGAVAKVLNGTGSAITIMGNPMTTAGDLILGGASGAAGRLAIGTSGYVLTSNGTTAAWAASAAGFADPMTTRGDIIIRDATNTTARLGIGANTYVLTSNGTDISWAAPTASSGWLTTGTTTLTGDVTVVATTTNTIEFEFNALTTGTSTCFTLANNTAATGGATVQNSPPLMWRGRAWTGAASQTVDFKAYVLPATAATPTGKWVLASSINGGALVKAIQVDSDGTNIGINFNNNGATLVGTTNGRLTLAGAGILRFNTQGTIQYNHVTGSTGIASGVISLRNLNANTGTTTGTHSEIGIGSGWNPASGTAVYNMVIATQTIDNAGSGVAKLFNIAPTWTAQGADAFFIDYSPTVTSITGVHYCWRSTAGLMALSGSTTGSATFRIAHGSAPSSPVDGDIWTTTAGLYVRINGATVGPLS